MIRPLKGRNVSKRINLESRMNDIRLRDVLHLFDIYKQNIECLDFTDGTNIDGAAQFIRVSAFMLDLSKMFCAVKRRDFWYQHCHDYDERVYSVIWRNKKTYCYNHYVAYTYDHGPTSMATNPSDTGAASAFNKIARMYNQSHCSRGCI